MTGRVAASEVIAERQQWAVPDKSHPPILLSALSAAVRRLIQHGLVADSDYPHFSSMTRRRSFPVRL
jgi:hypothetical protein